MKKLVCLLLALTLVFIAGRISMEMRAGAQAGRLASANGDTNADGKRDISDAVHLLNWLFSGGPEPAAFADSPEITARVGALEEKVAMLQGTVPGADPLARALEEIASLGGTGFAAGDQPLWAYRAVSPGDSSVVSLRIGDTSLGEVRGFRVEEALSAPTRMEVIAEVADPAFDPRPLAGAPLALTYAQGERQVVFQGFVERIDLAGKTAESSHVRVTGYSRLHRLARGRKSRLFSGESVPEVIARVLEPYDVDFEFQQGGIHPTRELIVQYHESDLAFLSRLLEEEGIHYSFREGPDGDVVRFGDGTRGRIPPPAGEVIAYRGHLAPPAPGAEAVLALHAGAAEFTGKATVGAYDFERATPTLVSAMSSDPLARGEDYEFGLRFLDFPSLQAQAAVRLAENLAGRHPVQGTGNSGGFRAGREVQIGGGDQRFDGKYYVTGASHKYVHAGGDGGYVNQFTCIPAAVAFRPPRLTPKPAAPGVATAVVLALPGQEVFTDKHGRVKVKFHWDREGTIAETTAWVRVAQPAAGKNSGMLFLPEVDDEVLIAFAHGDLDQPYVIGSLWNGKNVPPYALPGASGSKVIRSAMGPAGPNEILFDDRLDVQSLLLRSPKDLFLDAPATTVTGPLESGSNAEPGLRMRPGLRHRDNAIVAWARVDARGQAQSELGVLSVRLVRLGSYLVTVDAAAANPGELIPMAIADVPVQPESAADMRFVSVQQASVDSFNVFVNDGTGRPAVSGFVFMATAR